MLRFIFRLILWLLIFYLLYRFLRSLVSVVRRTLEGSGGRPGRTDEEAPPQPKIHFKEIKDAEFEELRDDENQKDKKKVS